MYACTERPGSEVRDLWCPASRGRGNESRLRRAHSTRYDGASHPTPGDGKCPCRRPSIARPGHPCYGRRCGTPSARAWAAADASGALPAIGDASSRPPRHRAAREPGVRRSRHQPRDAARAAAAAVAAGHRRGARRGDPHGSRRRADRLGRGRAARVREPAAGGLGVRVDRGRDPRRARLVGPAPARPAARRRRRVRVGQPDRAAAHRQRARRVRRRPAQPRARGGRPAGDARVLLQRLRRPGAQARRVGARDPERRAGGGRRLPRRVRGRPRGGGAGRRRGRRGRAGRRRRGRPRALGLRAGAGGHRGLARAARGALRRLEVGGLAAQRGLGRSRDRAPAGRRAPVRAGRRAVVPVDRRSATTRTACSSGRRASPPTSRPTSATSSRSSAGASTTSSTSGASTTTATSRGPAGRRRPWASIPPGSRSCSPAGCRSSAGGRSSRCRSGPATSTCSTPSWTRSATTRPAGSSRHAARSSTSRSTWTWPAASRPRTPSTTSSTPTRGSPRSCARPPPPACPPRPTSRACSSGEPEALLVRAIARYPEVVEDAVAAQETQGITAYATELATQFHAFYRDARVVDAEQPERSTKRLALALAAMTTLANALALLGISAPESM